MPTAYIALGSNFGDRQRNIDNAIRHLRAIPGITVAEISPRSTRSGTARPDSE